MKLHFNTIAEPSTPGLKWQKLFNTHWAAYRTWFISKEASNAADLKTSQAALKKYMPEMWPTYKRLCKLAKADDVAARFLTGFQPPAYIGACSQAILPGDGLKLVRNYDFHPDLTEGVQLFTAWNGKKVIATSDCLIGVLDGMNEDGLAISLTFGGRKEVGMGFGIPFIMRYILEFCSNVEEAVSALKRIPSHMSYNVTAIDRSGAHKTVQVAPDKAPLVTYATYATNHQGKVDWPENAAFNKTLERSEFIGNMLKEREEDAHAMADAFLQPPLYNKMFKEGFGTLYTAVYHPAKGTVQLRWPNMEITQDFVNFKEEYKLIRLVQNAKVPVQKAPRAEVFAEVENSVDHTYNSQTNDWQRTLTDILVSAMSYAKPSADKKELEKLDAKLNKGGEVSWEALADFWAKKGTAYSKNWNS
ncbi:C45 family peptidase [Algoriphagus sp. D3-2-R+10]|uniref:C45 family peptidase n=1 Tax=Algoriphagus aurantiacus TaxID=3103948 RepID=UPI002B39C4A5|nr:C45 family peptidase [Algoriphagus sp. D3-2-R+10]MEB2777401.1 C45 family peptidase [Algoriphagus sp. D3-2-R+10]